MQRPIEAGEIEDVVLGCGLPEGATGHNVARNAALYAGFGAGVPGITVNRYCGSGLTAASFVANAIARGEIACGIAGFLDQRLGKGVVPAKDRPNFIANRIGTFGMMATVHEMLSMGFSPTEVDQMTGKAIGHAKSATFRTSDLVGLDVLAHVNNNLYPAIPDDEDREVFKLPDVIEKMLAAKILGEDRKSTRLNSSH